MLFVFARGNFVCIFAVYFIHQYDMEMFKKHTCLSVLFYGFSSLFSFLLPPPATYRGQEEDARNLGKDLELIGGDLYKAMNSYEQAEV